MWSLKPIPEHVHISKSQRIFWKYALHLFSFSEVFTITEVIILKTYYIDIHIATLILSKYFTTMIRVNKAGRLILYKEAFKKIILDVFKYYDISLNLTSIHSVTPKSAFFRKPRTMA